MAINGYIYRPAPSRYRLHELIAAFAISCMIGGLLSDIAYWKSAEFLWADFSDWLVSLSVVASVTAIIAAVIEYFISHGRRRLVPRLPYLVAGIVVLVLATLNMMIHSRDAWTSVVPWGLTLSLATVVVLLLTAVWRIVALRRAGQEVEP